MDKPLKAAEEAFLMVRDLSVSRDGHFRFQDYRDAYASRGGYKWKGMHAFGSTRNCGIDLTVSRMIEAQLRGGTIKRVARGVYKFVESQVIRFTTTSEYEVGMADLRPAHPLYRPR